MIIEACRRAIAAVAALLSACWAVVCPVKNAPVDPPVRNEYGEIILEAIWQAPENDYGKDTCPECRS